MPFPQKQFIAPVPIAQSHQYWELLSNVQMDLTQTKISVNEFSGHPFLQDPPRDSGDKAKKCKMLGYVAILSFVSMDEFHQTLGFGAKPFSLLLLVKFLKVNRIKDETYEVQKSQVQSPTPWSWQSQTQLQVGQ